MIETEFSEEGESTIRAIAKEETKKVKHILDKVMLENRELDQRVEKLEEKK